MKLDLKSIMEDFSDPSMYLKIHTIYSEAEKGNVSKNSEKFQFSHLAFAMGELLDPNSIKKAGASGDNYKDVIKNIDATQGDFKKIKGYDTMKKVLAGSKTIADATKKSKYLETVQGIHDTLVDNKKVFENGYKKDVSVTRKLYQALCLGFILQCSTLATTMLVVTTSPKDDIDSYIDKTKGWNDLFIRTIDLVGDKDFNKFVKNIGNVTVIAEAEEAYADIRVNLVHLYSEVSLQDVALLFKLGLSRIAYKMCGLLRFLIYVFLVSKYSFDKKLAEMKAVIAFSESSLSDKSSEDESKLLANLVEMKTDDIKVMAAADNDIKNIKIKESAEEDKFEI